MTIETEQELQQLQEVGRIVATTLAQMLDRVEPGMTTLEVKGSSSVVKVGTKVKNIRLVDGDHDIDCKIDGIGAMKLKSEFVKKV